MITAVSNSRIKRIVQLQQKARFREQEEVFIIEGRKLFMEAVPSMIKEIYLTEGFMDKYVHGELKKRLAGFDYELVSEEVCRKISDTRTPQGILCIVRRFPYQLTDLFASKKGSAPFWLILEDIQDPGNLGTIIRTGEGAGLDGLIMSRGCVDVYNPKTIRATMGSVFRVPFIYADDLGAAIAKLKSSGLKVFAAALPADGEDCAGDILADSHDDKICDDKICDYTACDFIPGTAFLIGNEGNGLRAETIRNADMNIRIPMEGCVESLNAAAAAAILLYEVRRQRRQG